MTNGFPAPSSAAVQLQLIGKTQLSAATENRNLIQIEIWMRGKRDKI